MKGWRATTCCGTCAHFPIEEAKTASGAVITDRRARCQWQSREPWPISVSGWGASRPTPNFVGVLDGADCECHKPRAEVDALQATTGILNRAAGKS